MFPCQQCVLWKRSSQRDVCTDVYENTGSPQPLKEPTSGPIVRCHTQPIIETGSLALTRCCGIQRKAILAQVMHASPWRCCIAERLSLGWLPWQARPPTRRPRPERVVSTAAFAAWIMRAHSRVVLAVAEVGANRTFHGRSRVPPMTGPGGTLKA